MERLASTLCCNELHLNNIVEVVPGITTQVTDREDDPVPYFGLVCMPWLF